MRSVVSIRGVASGLLLLATGNLLSGCDETPDKSAVTNAEQASGPVTELAKKPATPTAAEPGSSPEKPVDKGVTESRSLAKPASEPVPAAQSAPDLQELPANELKQALLQRGWREIPGEDGSILLLPPRNTP